MCERAEFNVPFDIQQVILEAVFSGSLTTPCIWIEAVSHCDADNVINGHMLQHMTGDVLLEEDAKLHRIRANVVVGWWWFLY